MPNGTNVSADTSSIKTMPAEARRVSEAQLQTITQERFQGASGSKQFLPTSNKEEVLKILLLCVVSVLGLLVVYGYFTKSALGIIVPEGNQLITEKGGPPRLAQPVLGQ